MLHGWLILLRRGAATDVRKASDITRDDFENTRLQYPVYDAPYAYCRTGRA